MKKIYIGSTLLALMLSGQSCSENYDIYPEEYAKVVMIKDAGENPLSVYSTDDKVGHKFVVMKGGHTEEAATATLRAMTSEEFTTYQAESGKPYAMLPADCYSFSADGQTTSAEIKFAPNETYKEVEVFINADALGTFMETFDGSLYSPVVPVVLESSDASVNSYGSESFILPTYSEPTLSFASQIIAGSRGGEITANVTLPIQNSWDINFEVEVDTTVVSQCNMLNGTQYEAVDASALTGNTSFTLPNGSSSVDIKLNVDFSKFTALNSVLPLRITGISVDGIESNVTTGWIVVTMPRIPITAAMLSTNAQEPSEGPIANLLDGNVETFFHSLWSSTINEKHYIQVTLPETYSKVWIRYCNRHNNANNSLLYFYLYTGTSNDNLEFYKMYGWDTDGLKYGKAEWSTVSAELSTPQSVFRIEEYWTLADQANGIHFFSMSELEMYGY